MKTIEINGTEYNIKYTIRALFIFEQISGKSFKLDTLLDNYLLFYSMILACNKDNVLSWDDFIDAIDNDPQLLVKLNDAVEAQQKQDAIFNHDDTDKAEKKS
ncbi:MAG: hypothetical protein IKY15_03070 [Clostridia bacterium]|nr:hypothetical protein [Clostridia bacterium]